MKNNFIKQKINTQNKSNTSPSKRNRVLAYVLLAFMAFWSICSVLGLIAYFRNDNVKTASAQEISYATYRDSIQPDDSLNFFYKHYDFVGQASVNFSSPFRIQVNSIFTSSLTIYMRFNINNYEAPNGFNLFYNGATKTSPAFTRVLIDNITYYKCVISSSLMRSIVNLYGGYFSIMSLNYDYDVPYEYEFDLFIIRGTSDIFSPNYFEGFLASDNYLKGYSDALKASDFSEFFNGSGSFDYTIGSTSYHKSFVPSDLSTYFSNGVFLFSKYFLDTIGASNLSNFSAGTLNFTFSRELNISRDYFLSTSAYGSLSNNQELGIEITYYNGGYTAPFQGGTKPIVTITDTGVMDIDNCFWSIVNSAVVGSNGGLVVVPIGFVSNRFDIVINPDLIRSTLANSNNSINLGFPTQFYNGYQSGLIDGQLQFDSKVFYDSGYEAGKQFSEQRYQDGFTDGVNSREYSFLGLFGAVIDAPIQALTGLLNFEILGMNMMSFFMSILTLAIVIFVVRLML